MIINVLPIQEKKSLRKEYYLRLSTICLFLLVLLSLLATLLLLPPYVLSESKVAFFQSRVASIPSSSVVSEDDLTKSITDINTTLALLHNGQSSRDVSASLAHILSLRPSGVVFSQIFYTEQTPTNVVVTVQGTASNRASLQALQSAFQNDPSITSADLPISDFTKPANIDFSIDISLK